MDTTDTCPVCHEAVESYAIGDCDHPICYRCSIRMRVLCNQMYCPICRNDLTKVYLVRNVTKFSEIPRHGYIPNRKYKLFFEDDTILSKFEKLVEHRCARCKNRNPEKNFKALQDHLRREHTLFYCDLCVENLKIFTYERKLYNRAELATHRRLGDKNDSSYKGHPLCHFCDERYMDNDDLYRHLRKDHFYCHFCETDGSNDFYNDYDSLKDHFKAAHYLCEEGECGEMQTRFTHAFRSQIDLKAHVTATHNMKYKTKAEARQARTIEVEFQLPPRNRRKERGIISGNDYEEVSKSNKDDRVVRSGRGRGRGQGQTRISQKERFRDEEIQQAIQASLSVMKEKKNETKKEEEEKEMIPIDTVDNFPSLGNRHTVDVRPDSPATGDHASKDSDSDIKGSSMAGRIAQANKMSVQHGRLGLADFPALHVQDTNVKDSFIQQSGNSIGIKRDQKSASLKTNFTTDISISKMFDTAPVPVEDFPELPTSKKGNKSNISTAWGKKQKLEEQSSRQKVTGQLIGGGVNTKKDFSENPGQKSAKVMKVKKPSKNVLNDDKEFPSLGGSSQPGVLSNWGKIAKEERKPKEKQVDWFEIDDNMEFSMDNMKGDKNNFQVVEDKTSSKKKNKKKEKDKKQLLVKEQDFSGSNSSLDNIAGSLLSAEPAMQKSASSNSLSSLDLEKTKRMQNTSEKKTENAEPVQFESGNKKQKTSIDKFSDDDFPLVEKATSIPAHLMSDNIFNNLSQLSSSDEGKLVVENGIAGSRSLKKSSKPVLNNEDFPALGSTKDPPAPPPGFKSNEHVKTKKLPPGFGDIKSGSRPPPGFHVSPPVSDRIQEKPLLDVDIQKMLPMATDLSNFTYSKPENFATRNQKLISEISKCLEGDQEKFEDFKTWSRDFRAGSMVASEYYDRCQSLLGSDSFDTVLPELLVLLPDIPKQQELLTAHNKNQSRKKVKGSVIKISDSSNKAVWGNVQNFFQSCPTCRQVLCQTDYTQHISVHGNVDMNFPSLHSDTVPSGSVLRAWVKAK